MHDDYIASGTKGHRNDALAGSIADATETVRSKPHAGSEPAAGPSVQARRLSRLFLKASKYLIATLQGLEDIFEFFSERILREIRAIRRECVTRLDAIENRMKICPDGMGAGSEAQHKIQDVENDSLRRENELHTNMYLLMALCGLQFFIMGALTTMALMYWLGK